MPLEFAAVGAHELRRGAAAHGEDAAQLLHDADVIEILLPRPRPADVFKPAGHELLPVEVIRRVAGRVERAARKVEHLADLLPVGDGGVLRHEVGPALARQRVHGHVFGREREHLLERGAEAVRRVAGQARDQVHVHGEAAGLAHEAQRVENILRGVAAADGLEHAVVERLGIDADAVDPVRAQHVQLVGRDGVGPSGLDGELAQGAEIERRLELRAQRVELARRERGRRAAADVERHDAQTGALHGLCRRGDLARERLQKLRHERHALFHRLAHEAAVGAARRAKRDAHVQAHVLVAEHVHGAQRGVGGAHDERGARGRNVVVPLEIAHGLRVAHALCEQGGHELAGAHAREHAPRPVRQADAHGRAVKRALDRALQPPVGFGGVGQLVVGHARAAVGRPSVIDEHARRGRDLGAGHEPQLHAVAGRPSVRILRALVRKQRQEHLLHRIAVIMSDQIEIHGILFLLFPCQVRSGPWPCS